MNAVDALMDKVSKENIAAEQKSPAPTPAQVEREASFLRGWARTKPVTRLTADSTFWKSGKWMTKLTFKMVQALADAGHITLTGDPKKAGASFTMGTVAKRAARREP